MELFFEFGFGALHLLRGYCQLPPHRFLINQFFENNHLQRALPDGGFLLFGKSVVLAGVRKNLQHLAQQVAVCQDRSIDSRYGLVADLKDGIRGS